MMTEARYLEQFDYALPENIRHLALSVRWRKKIYLFRNFDIDSFSVGRKNETINNTIKNCLEKLSSSY